MKRALFLFLCISSLVVSSQEADLFSKNGIALDGYDVVSYFQGKPLSGNSEYKVNYKGGAYYFANSQNREVFLKSPESYLPQYGGWCAYAMGKTGRRVEIDPHTYKLIDGKLYLFYNQGRLNTLEKWNKNETELRLKADQNWTVKD